MIVAKKRIEIDPLTLFHRLCITKQSDEELKEYLKYELAPIPMSLFSEGGMRKGTKSSMYSAFTSASSKVNLATKNTFSVVDGGYLLHKVVWHRNDSVGTIVTKYAKYVQKHFGSNATVVFDGYPVDAAQKNTKNAERMRRSTVQSCADIMLLDETTLVPVTQDKFLTNEGNKRRLIALLRNTFQQYNIDVNQAEEDADVDIVKAAISKALIHKEVVIFGDDIDLLVLLNGLAPNVNNVYLIKQRSNEADGRQYSSSSFKYHSPDYPSGIVLFLHAISGCDTTSAIFGQGKTKCCTLLKKNPQLKELISVFLRQNSSAKDIANAGEKYLVTLYGGDMNKQNLDSLRYHYFIKAAAKTSKLSLARLPPTQDAAKYHFFRTYHTVQRWLGFEMEPTDWGWMHTDQGLRPILASKEPAPTSLLKLISCRCKKQCCGACSCKKAGLKCSRLCTFCLGQTCQNAPTPDLDESDIDEDEAVYILHQNEEFTPDPSHTPIIDNTISEEEDYSTPGPSKRTEI